MISAFTFLSACIVMFITGWVVSAVTNFTPRSLPKPNPPPSLAEHVSTFREIVSASGEMTPQVEEWLARVSQEQKALPALGAQTVDVLFDRHCFSDHTLEDVDGCVKQWNQILSDLALETNEVDKISALRAWVNGGQIFTDYEGVQLVSMFTEAKNRRAVRKLLHQPADRSEVDTDTDTEAA